MSEFLKSLDERIYLLKNVICTKEIELLSAPEGALHISESANRVQYYLKTDEGEKRKRYLKNREEKLVQELCQKDYDKKVLQSAKKELYQLERLKKSYPTQLYGDVYETLHPHRKKHVQPIILSDEEYEKQWEQVEYIGKAFRDDAPEYYTDKGERVRSKTEILIANALCKHKVPYRYEAPLHLKGYGTIHPDFTVLNVRLRKEFYWEHMGMMDDFEYAENALLRIGMYEKNDIFPGNKLILTHETARRPINSRNIEKMISQYLK